LIQVLNATLGEFMIRITFQNGFEDLFADGPLFVVEHGQE
jgi:hypothetical protein